MISGENVRITHLVRITHNRCRIFNDCDLYIHAIDVDYDSEDSIFTVLTIKLHASLFPIVISSEFGIDCDFQHEDVEYCGNNCFITRKVFCFIHRIKQLTGKDFMKENIEFIRNERHRRNVMTRVRVHHVVEEIISILNIIMVRKYIQAILVKQLEHFFHLATSYVHFENR